MPRTAPRVGRVFSDAPSPRWLSHKCFRKERYETEQDEGLKRHLDKLRSAGYDRDRLVAYACDVCGGWHVGHVKKGEQEK